MGVIIFDDRRSIDYRIQVEHPPGYNFPERDYEITHVPRRNGDVVKDNGAYKNTTRSYEIALGDYEQTFEELMANISQFLYSNTGYARLEDSYSPEYYRMALFVGPFDVENILFHAGRATIDFNCMPQKFLKLGDKPMIFSGDGTIWNPTNQISKPIITVTGSGSGTLTINDKSISVSSLSSPLIINSEIEDIYDAQTGENRNSDVSLLDRVYPTFRPGDNTISIQGEITSVEVVPKWWTT